MKKIIYNEKAPKPMGIYSQGIAAAGFIFVSGQLPVDPKENKIIPGDIRVQVRQVFKNIEQILTSEGADLKDIVKIGAFLLNSEDMKGMNEVFQEIFPENPPARTTVTVKTFPPEVLVEIDAIALKKDENR